MIRWPGGDFEDVFLVYWSFGMMMIRMMLLLMMMHNLLTFGAWMIGQIQPPGVLTCELWKKPEDQKSHKDHMTPQKSNIDTQTCHV